MAKRTKQHSQDATTPSVDHAPERPALAVLRDIKEGKIQGKSLSPSARRDIVGALIAQGASVPEIAHSLGISDRTIQRDLDALRREHGARINPNFVFEAIGALWLNTQTRLSKLDRIASDPSASHQDKTRAIRVSSRIENESFHRLQTLGALPHVISERMAARGPSSLHVHQHNGAIAGPDAEGDQYALIELEAASLERLSEVAERSSSPKDAAVAKRARAAAKRVKNSAAAQRGEPKGKPRAKQPTRSRPKTQGKPGTPGTEG